MVESPDHAPEAAQRDPATQRDFAVRELQLRCDPPCRLRVRIFLRASCGKPNVQSVEALLATRRSERNGGRVESSRQQQRVTAGLIDPLFEQPPEVVGSRNFRSGVGGNRLFFTLTRLFVDLDHPAWTNALDTLQQGSGGRHETEGEVVAHGVVIQHVPVIMGESAQR